MTLLETTIFNQLDIMITYVDIISLCHSVCRNLMRYLCDAA